MTGRGPVVLASRVGAAEGVRAAAAALACAGSGPDRAGLLVDLGAGRPPRPALIATSAARRLEERLAAHLPDATVAARGQICHLTLAPVEEALDRVPAALAPARESVAVVALPAGLLRAAPGAGVEATATLLRADLHRDRALAALAVRGLIESGLSVSVLKRALGWVPARRALFGLLPADSPEGLPARLRARCLEATPGGGG